MKTMRPDSAPDGCRAEDTTGLNFGVTTAGKFRTDFVEKVSAKSGVRPERHAVLSLAGLSADSSCARATHAPTQSALMTKLMTRRCTTNFLTV